MKRKANYLKNWFIMGIGACLVLCCGCKSIGPSTVPRDRFDYSASISESWKRQTLLNIIRLRYLDPPTFVDVGQIVAGYTLEAAVNAGGTLSSAAAVQGNYLSAGGAARFTDRPTITYTPLTGPKFIRSLMSPLPPESVLYTVQSGWPANAVFYSAVGAMNGLKNQETTIDGMTPPDPKFLRALELLRKIQLTGAVGLRVRQGGSQGSSTILTFQTKDITDETLADIKELRGLLRLDPNATEIQIAFGATASSDRELALQTRSILHIMMAMAAQAEVPPEDLAQGRVSPGYESIGAGGEATRLIRIHSSKSKPNDTYVLVQFRDHWFWIDDRDLRSKRAFSFMMMLFTLAETGDKENLPVITIPAQ
ncbi:MAG TPA: hypothetical protein VL361_29775 [Candidatus Limnocylindrales bacterium]|nr:hypothetical protein [Candidatus Limnocylindrales bacterium]